MKRLYLLLVVLSAISFSMLYAQDADREALARQKYDVIKGTLENAAPKTQQEAAEILKKQKASIEGFIKEFSDTKAVVDAYITLSQIQVAFREYDAAISSLEQVCSIAPKTQEHASALGTIARLLNVQEKPLEGLKKLEEVKKTFPGTENAVQASLDIARFYGEMGQAEKGLTELSEAEKTLPDPKFMKDIIKGKIQLYCDAGDYDNAKKQIDLFGEKFPKSKNELAGIIKDYDLRIGGTPYELNVSSLEGNMLTLAALKGKVVLIDFWATWCPPCRDEMPNVIKTYGELNAKGFEIIGISLDQDAQKLKQFIKDKGMKWPQYFDGKGWQNAIAQLYGVNSIPMTYLLDKKGIIRYKGVRGEELLNAVKKLLDEKE